MRPGRIYEGKGVRNGWTHEWMLCEDDIPVIPCMWRIELSRGETKWGIESNL